MKKLALLATLAIATPALGADIVVGSTADDGQRCTLRDAIRTAQNAPSYAGLGGCTDGSSGVDRVVLAAGIYALGAGGPDEDAGAGGDLDVTEALIIEGADRGTTILDGRGRDRVLHLHRGRVEIRGVTVRGGDAQRSDGGGIYVLAAASLVLTSAIVSDNVSFIGGGGIDALGDLELEDVIIERNRTQNDGGLRCLASCTGRLTDVIVRDNTATGNVGGGLGAAGNLFMLRTQVIGNHHTGQLGAGGVSALQSDGGTNTIVMVESLIADNDTTGDGGGLRLGTIPGFFAGPPRVALVNTTIAGNRAARGGGVSVGIGQLTLSSVTIAYNTGGGVVNGGGTIEARNTLVARNDRDCEGALSSRGYVLVSGTNGCTIAAGQGDKPNVEPMLASGLADNGGPSRTIALSPFSPAVDAGDPAGPTDGMMALMNDQRGLPRVAGPRADIGAFELEGGAVITMCGDGKVEGIEACDDGAANSDTTPGACRTNCVRPSCADTVVDPGEMCSGTPDPEADDGGCATTGPGTTLGILAVLLLAMTARNRARKILRS